MTKGAVGEHRLAAQDDTVSTLCGMQQRLLCEFVQAFGSSGAVLLRLAWQHHALESGMSAIRRQAWRKDARRLFLW